MARMTAAQMMGGFRTSPLTGAPMPERPTGRVAPLPAGAGSKNFKMDMDGDMDGDVSATSGGPARIADDYGGKTASSTSLSADLRK